MPFRKETIEELVTLKEAVKSIKRRLGRARVPQSKIDLMALMKQTKGRLVHLRQLQRGLK